jgi:hypothetical protein
LISKILKFYTFLLFNLICNPTDVIAELTNGFPACGIEDDYHYQIKQQDKTRKEQQSQQEPYFIRLCLEVSVPRRQSTVLLLR